MSIRFACASWTLAMLPLSLNAQAPSAVGGIHPNTEVRITRPLRYQPRGDSFVIHNGSERFNRPLYGGNTAFRVDGGDLPEFVLYLPGRGGNLRLAMRSRNETRWLHAAADITSGYRPGELFYEIRDPMLGERGELRISALAYAETEGLILQVSARGISAGVELLWAFGGVNGQRGKRDGDIGTEGVPISEWFQPNPEFALDNRVQLLQEGTFKLDAKAATLVGVTSQPVVMRIADADHWDHPAELFAALDDSRQAMPARPLVVGTLPINAESFYLSVQRVAGSEGGNKELDIYDAVTAKRQRRDAPAAHVKLAAPFSATSLAARFQVTREHFAALRSRVAIDTPDPFLNAAVGALNVGADALWDEPQQAIMHGAIAWRAKLLGWRGPYALDALGWHERARANFSYWFGRQNLDPIPARLPPADEDSNLARSEGAWAGHVNAMANIDDSGLRRAALPNGLMSLPDGVTFKTPRDQVTANVIFTSHWDNYPREVAVPLCGRASHAHLLMAGSTNHMQSRIDNGEVVVTYADGTKTRFPLRNPSTWWPIDQDYLTDAYQFPLRAMRPTRVDLKSGQVRMASSQATSHGGAIDGGAATVLDFPLETKRALKSITVRALANDVVIGLMAVTLARPAEADVCN